MKKEMKKVPAIRFKGFTDDWEQHKVSNMFEVTRGSVLASSLIEKERTETMPYPVYSSQTKENGLMGYYSNYLYENAITWTTDGANAGTVNYRKGKFYCTNVCGVLISKEFKASKMMAEALNKVAKKYVSYVGNPKLMNNIMAAIEIPVPNSVAEQERISCYFTILDNLITLHQRKSDQLKKLKAYFLQNLFPAKGEKVPKIRFKGFTGDWEQRKLGDGMYIKSRIGWQKLTKNEYLANGEYYLITGTDINENNHTVDLSKSYFVSKERYDKDKNIQVHDGDIIVTKDGTIGKVAMVCNLDKPATLNSHLFVLRDLSGKLDNRFLLQILSSPLFKRFIDETKTGSTLTGLPQKTFINFQFMMPLLKEQKKIASTLDRLDALITLHQRKLDALQTLKKYLLQNLFI